MILNLVLSVLCFFFLIMATLFWDDGTEIESMSVIVSLIGLVLIVLAIFKYYLSIAV